MRSCPRPPTLLDAESSLRTLHSYVGILQTRLALARLTGNRNEFERVTENQLVQLTLLCERVTNVIDGALDRMAPELASTAAMVAELACQREFDRPSPSPRPHLRLAVDGDRPAR